GPASSGRCRRGLAPPAGAARRIWAAAPRTAPGWIPPRGAAEGVAGAACQTLPVLTKVRSRPRPTYSGEGRRNKDEDAPRRGPRAPRQQRRSARFVHFPGRGGLFMKRRVGALMLAAAMGGCMSTNHGPANHGEPTVRASGQYSTPTVPGFTGPWGEPVPMAAPYRNAPPVSSWQAKQLMMQSVPLSAVNMNPGVVQAGAQMPAMPPGGMMAPPGMPMMPGAMPPGGGMMPPNMPGPGGANMLNMPHGPMSMMMGAPPNTMPPMPGGAAMPPGSMPFMPGGPFPGGPPPGAVAALGAITGPGYMPGGPGYKIGRTQIRFARPSGMRVAWLTPGPDGKPMYSAPVIEAPGRYNFLQASIYRLKLSNIEGRPGMEVYPTLEVVPCNPKTEAFLAHSAVPVEFTPEDFQEVASGKYLIKVIYLPDPQFQELATAGIEEIISTQLPPGADPPLEAQRRGCILLVIRMGNVDQEAPNTPPLESQNPQPGPTSMMPPGMMPPGMGPPGMAGPAGPVGPGAPSAPPYL